MKCKSCGAENSVNATKCEYCGNLISKTQKEPVDPARAIAMKGADISFLKQNQEARILAEQQGMKAHRFFCLGCLGLLVLIAAIIGICCS